MSDHEWYGSNFWMQHVLWLLLSLTLVFVVIVFISLILKFKEIGLYHPAVNRKGLNKFIVAVTVIGLSFYTIACIIFLTAEILQNSYNWTGYPYPFICVTWGMANVCAYLLYIDRLTRNFKNTLYEATKSLIYTFYILILLFCTSQILETALNIAISMNLLANETAQFVFIISFGFDGITDFIMSVILLYLFVKKILTLTSDSVDYDQLVSGHRRVSTMEFDSKQSNLLYVVTRQFVLR